jgi:hypothetical protein
MKSVDEAEAQAHWDEILDEAQRQPIVIRRQEGSWRSCLGADLACEPVGDRMRKGNGV